MIGPDDAARQRPDVRAPVAADLGLVADAAQGDPHEAAAQCVGHGLAQRGLADPGRPGQQDHGARAAAADDLQAALGAPGPDREVLHDPLLDLLEAVVVGVEDLAGPDHVVVVLGALVPGQLEHGVEPGADPGGLGALVAGALELVDLLQQGGAHGVGHVGGLDPGAVVVGALRLALAELLADRGELLAQQVLALRLLHAVADLLADLVGELRLGEVLAGPGDERLEALLDVGGLQQLALAVVGEVRRVAGRVGDRAGVGHPVHGVDDLPGLAALEHGDDEPLVLLGQLAGAVGDVLVDRLDLDPQGGAGAGDPAADAGALLGRSTAAGPPFAPGPPRVPTRSTVATTPYDA